MLFYVCFVIYVHKCATCVMCVECIYIVGQEYSSVYVFLGCGRKERDNAYLSLCVGCVVISSV